jgi:hypothetical protein
VPGRPQQLKHASLVPKGPVVLLGQRPPKCRTTASPNRLIKSTTAKPHVERRPNVTFARAKEAKFLNFSELGNTKPQM